MTDVIWCVVSKDGDEIEFFSIKAYADEYAKERYGSIVAKFYLNRGRRGM